MKKIMRLYVNFFKNEAKLEVDVSEMPIPLELVPQLEKRGFEVFYIDTKKVLRGELRDAPARVLKISRELLSQGFSWEEEKKEVKNGK